MDLRIFVEPQQGATYDQQAGVAKVTEEEGFDAFFRSDHLSKMGEVDGMPGPTDSWITLGAIARETTRIRLGTLVTSMTFRLPAMLAVSVAQVDNMSNGRVELGIGTGWNDEEHDHHGIPFPPFAERFDRLGEQLEILRGMWTTPVGETFDFDGEHYRLVDSPALPKPTQPGGPPVIIGGYGPKKTPALAARFAAEYNTPFFPLAGYAEQCDRVRSACEDIGRDPDDMIFSAAVVVCCGESDEEVAHRANAIGRSVDELTENGLCGSPAQVVEGLAEWAEAGAERVYLQVLDMDDLDHVRLLGRDVLPVIP